MSGNGDIGELVGIADTIASPAGTITTRPLIPASWTAATPTLSTGTVTTPPAQGGLESDAPKATDPDQFVGSLALAAVAPTLSTGSHSTPAGNGDVGDVFGAPDLAGEAQAAGLVAFQQVTPTIGPVSGSWLPPIAHGDIPDVGGPTTLQGDTNDSNAGVSTLITWAQGSPTLATGSIPQTQEHGDIGEMYGQGEGPIGQAVWSVATPALAVGPLGAPTGQGDIVNPYSWQDVVLYLTSWTYPVVTIENFTLNEALTGAFFMPDLISEHENFTLGLALTGGNIHLALLIYNNYPPENYTLGFTMTGGSLTITTGYVVYNNWPPENYTLGLTMPSGSLTVTTGYIVYNNWPPENYTLGLTLTGGSLA